MCIECSILAGWDCCSDCLARFTELHGFLYACCRSQDVLYLLAPSPLLHSLLQRYSASGSLQSLLDLLTPFSACFSDPFFFSVVTTPFNLAGTLVIVQPAIWAAPVIYSHTSPLRTAPLAVCILPIQICPDSAANRGNVTADHRLQMVGPQV